MRTPCASLDSTKAGGNRVSASHAGACDEGFHRRGVRELGDIVSIALSSQTNPAPRGAPQAGGVLAEAFPRRAVSLKVLVADPR